MSELRDIHDALVKQTVILAKMAELLATTQGDTSQLREGLHKLSNEVHPLSLVQPEVHAAIGGISDTVKRIETQLEMLRDDVTRGFRLHNHRLVELEVGADEVTKS